MKRRSAIWVAAAVVSAGLGFYLWRLQQIPEGTKVTKEDVAKAAKALGRVAPLAPKESAPVDISHSMRLAIGSLGFADDERNRRVSDLALAELSGAPGLILVERQDLEAIQHEQSLSLSGLVRAKDAVRVGKLLKADWFLLGTEARLGGTNSTVVRLVDVHTGILRDAGIISAGVSPTRIASSIAGFVRRSREDAARARTRVYLAIGTFEDLSVNNRLANFPTQLRAYLMAAYRNSSLTLLEREYVEALLQEVRLDLAGLAEGSTANQAQPMQSAFWLVGGHYQSYETTNIQVELELEVERIFSTVKRFALRSPPGDSMGEEVRKAIDQAIKQGEKTVIPSRMSEARSQMVAGKALEPFSDGLSLVFPGDYRYWRMDEGTSRKVKRNLTEAIRAFQTVLLLEPGNREAKVHLANCLESPVINRWDEALNYYREIIDEDAHDRWAGLAQEALVVSFNYRSPEESARWFGSAAGQTTNSPAAQFYHRQAEAAARTIAIERADGSKAEQLAEQRLSEAVESFYNFLQNKGGVMRSDMGMDDYVKAFGDDRTVAAQKTAAIVPRLKQQWPQLELYLWASALAFQLDSNSPVVGEFQKSLERCLEHPEQVFKIESCWNHLQWQVYDWCFERTNYDLAVKVMEGERQAAAQGHADFDEMEKIKLAYAYLATSHWNQALDVFESFSNNLVEAKGDGPWGRAFAQIPTDKMVAYCREKLGMTSDRDPREFDIGPNRVCMHTPSAFSADDSGLWLCIAGQLLRLDLDFRTNAAFRLPIGPEVSISCLLVGSDRIWIGTAGAGLFEFDKSNRQCRQFREADGMMMDSVASLHENEESLWIGYGGVSGGGLGRMDLRSHRFTSFMPSLVPTAEQQPPSQKIENIASGARGDLWLQAGTVVRTLRMKDTVWGTLSGGDGSPRCLAADAERLVEGNSIYRFEVEIETQLKDQSWTNQVTKETRIVTFEDKARLEATIKTNGLHQRISGTSSGRVGPAGGVSIFSFRSQQWESFRDADGLPNPPTALALDGNNLWVGGKGYLALIDLKERKVRKYCHTGAEAVDRIQIAAGYVWAQYDWHLHRASIVGLN
jgi:tetratricopeptide (TPR) repeat protein